jgi:NodT family efflux transporter outer membrane factor (OMF) lipoprotein
MLEARVCRGRSGIRVAPFSSARRCPRRYACWGVLLLTTALSGCDLAPHYQVPLTQVPVNYKEAAVWQKGYPADQVRRGSWWQLFGDPTLNGLEAQVDGANPDLATAYAAFQRAAAFAAEARSGAYPQLSIGGEINSDRQSNRRPTRRPGQPNQYMSNEIDAQAHYEVDLWDRVANSIKAGRQAAQASAADLEATRLSLHAELASDYVMLRGLDAQSGVLTHAVQAFTQALQLTQARFSGDISSEMDVSRAQAQLDGAKAALIDIAASRALEEHAVAALVGKVPAQLTIAPAAWQLVAPSLSPGLPSTLLERRPDVASAERQMAAANSTIGVARAAFYPTLSLDMLYGLQDSGFGLFSLPNELWAVGPGLAMPLFEGGLRDAQEAAAIAAYKEAVGQYRATVLGAFQEVEDDLSQIRLLTGELREEDAAVTAARHTVTMTMNLYRDGATSFLDVVVAQTAELQAEQKAADLRARREEASVGLVRAIGGGWSRADLPVGNMRKAMNDKA